MIYPHIIRGNMKRLALYYIQHLLSCSFSVACNTNWHNFPPLSSRIAAATTHRLMAHNSKEDTFHTRPQLLGYHLECNNDRHHYTRELVNMIDQQSRFRGCPRETSRSVAQSAANQAEYARVRAEERKREQARLMKLYREDYIRRVEAAERGDENGRSIRHTSQSLRDFVFLLVSKGSPERLSIMFVVCLKPTCNLAQLLTDEEKERVKDVRAKMYYIYRLPPGRHTVEQFKVAACVETMRGHYHILQ